MSPHTTEWPIRCRKRAAIRSSNGSLELPSSALHVLGSRSRVATLWWTDLCCANTCLRSWTASCWPVRCGPSMSRRRGLSATPRCGASETAFRRGDYHLRAKRGGLQDRNQRPLLLNPTSRCDRPDLFDHPSADDVDGVVEVDSRIAVTRQEFNLGPDLQRSKIRAFRNDLSVLVAGGRATKAGQRFHYGAP